MTLTYDLTFRRAYHHDPEPCRKIGFVCGGEHGPPVWEVETPDGERIYVAPENVEERHHD